MPHTAQAQPKKLQEIFISKNDPDDLRLGDIILRGKAIAENERDVDIAIIGIPQDVGIERNGGRIGAAQAPDAIRRALYKLTPNFGETALKKENFTIIDLGDMAVEGLALEDIHRRQQEIVSALLKQGVIPVVLGGGHDIAFPNGAALGTLDKDFGVINLDAHPDVRPLLHGKRGHSGSPFRQLLEGQTHLKSIVEFGIQPFAASPQHLQYVRDKGQTVTMLQDIRDTGFKKSFEAALKKVSAKKQNVFVSFDMDSVTSAYAPGVSAPSAIGFSGDEICSAAYLAGEKSYVKIIDIVEVNPNFDIDGRTAKLAALVAAHFIAGVYQRKNGKSKGLF
jgi:formimidoylglutamase